MCDTFVVLPDSSRYDCTIFGKNSDREPDEAQAIERLPAQRHGTSSLRCTYISVPQSEYTYEVIISRPFHMWGAEMGINEHGVAIGNEAVFTRMRFAKKNVGLTGMDMLRIALERSRTAIFALETIVDLLESWGQDACGGYRNKHFFYHNSFLIADAREAWVLETAGKHWAAQRISKGFRTISNRLSIGSDYDLVSAGAIEYATRRGWHRGSEKTFRFDDTFSDWLYTALARGAKRSRLTYCNLEASAGTCGLGEAIEILKLHHPPGRSFRPAKATTASVCMHATGLLNPSNTTGSMVALIPSDAPPVVWLTGTSMPCLSVYLPFFFGGQTLLPDTWTMPGAQPDKSLWWRAERLHRAICRDYWRRREAIESERATFQARIFTEWTQHRQAGSALKVLDDWSAALLQEYSDLVEKWTQIVENMPRPRRYFFSWKSSTIHEEGR